MIIELDIPPGNPIIPEKLPLEIGEHHICTYECKNGCLIYEIPDNVTFNSFMVEGLKNDNNDFINISRIYAI